jgi:ferritin
MDLSPKLIDMLNAQMCAEMRNHLVYNTFAGALSAQNWPGFAKFMRKAADDEWGHSQKFEEFLVDRNQIPNYNADLIMTSAPQAPVLQYFTDSLMLERTNTALIIDLMKAATAEDDVQTSVWLIWAIDEQTRSERELLDAILEIQRVGPDGLLILDREYEERSSNNG